MQSDGLTPEELSKVIARAIAFDETRRAKYSEAEIRYTASQVGVSSEAVDAALQSIQTDPLDRQVGPRPTLVQLMRAPAAWGFMAGVSISALYAVAINIFNMNSAMQVPNWAMNSLMMASGALSVLSATDRNARRYFARNLGLWFGFGMGVYAVYKVVVFNLFNPGHLPVGVILSHVLEVPIIALTLSTLVGGLMISRRRLDDHTDSNDMNVGVLARISRVFKGFKKFMNQRIDLMKAAFDVELQNTRGTAGQNFP